jgi:hypothetical protein
MTVEGHHSSEMSKAIRGPMHGLQLGKPAVGAENDRAALPGSKGAMGNSGVRTRWDQPMIIV